MHPGHVKTNMTTKNAPAVMRFFMNFIPGHVSIDKASENVVNVATRSEFIDKTGLYVVRSAISKAKKTTYDFNLQEKIWKKSNELVNENFP